MDSKLNQKGAELLEDMAQTTVDIAELLAEIEAEKQLGEEDSKK